jgi:hypothetical protein
MFQPVIFSEISNNSGEVYGKKSQVFVNEKLLRYSQYIWHLDDSVILAGYHTFHRYLAAQEGSDTTAILEFQRFHVLCKYV